MTRQPKSKQAKSARASKKLKLNKETLRDLAPKRAGAVKGGVRTSTKCETFKEEHTCRSCGVNCVQLQMG